jgi:hypothetical protein
VIPAGMAAWSTRQWAALVGVLVLVILIMAMAWPRTPSTPDHIVVRVVDGPTVLSTQMKVPVIRATTLSRVAKMSSRRTVAPACPPLLALSRKAASPSRPCCRM